MTENIKVLGHTKNVLQQLFMTILRLQRDLRVFASAFRSKVLLQSLFYVKFKKQATYLEGDHTIFKSEYWDTPI